MNMNANKRENQNKVVAIFAMTRTNIVIINMRGVVINMF